MKHPPKSANVNIIDDREIDFDSDENPTVGISSLTSRISKEEKTNFKKLELLQKVRSSEKQQYFSQAEEESGQNSNSIQEESDESPQGGGETTIESDFGVRQNKYKQQVIYNNQFLPRKQGRQPHKKNGYRFQEDIKKMMYGFGDDLHPNPETTELMEQYVIEYLQNMTSLVLSRSHRGGHNHMQLGDLIHYLKSDPVKYYRVP